MLENDHVRKLWIYIQLLIAGSFRATIKTLKKSREVGMINFQEKWNLFKAKKLAKTII